MSLSSISESLKSSSHTIFNKALPGKNTPNGMKTFVMRFSRPSFRQKPAASNQNISSSSRPPEVDHLRETILQNEVWRLEEELYRKNKEEDRIIAERQKIEQDEIYKQKQLAMQIQEAENRRQEQLRKTTPEALRRMQDLIRTRHELDLEIWRARDVNKENRDILVQKGMKADEILQEIYSIVDIWEESGWDQREWEVARKIKRNLEAGNQRIWSSNPPWIDRDA